MSRYVTATHIIIQPKYWPVSPGVPFSTPLADAEDSSAAPSALFLTTIDILPNDTMALEEEGSSLSELPWLAETCFLLPYHTPPSSNKNLISTSKGTLCNVTTV